MLKEVVHIGLTVRNLEDSVRFYKGTLGLKETGRLHMEGKETDILFNIEGCRADICYLKGNEHIMCPPIELIDIVSDIEDKNHNFEVTMKDIRVSEICFKVDDIDEEYKRLKALGVEFLSEPQSFDFSEAGYGRSKAVYLRDNDGNVLELIEYL